MSSFSYSQSGEPIEVWIAKMLKGDVFSVLDSYARQGQQALAAATPRESGLTASSWTYEIKKENGTYSIIWGNTNIVDGTPVAVLLQVGHGTGTGGYVRGVDYINPALKPIFDSLSEAVWKAVSGV